MCPPSSAHVGVPEMDPIAPSRWAPLAPLDWSPAAALWIDRSMGGGYMYLSIDSISHVQDELERLSR